MLSSTLPAMRLFGEMAICMSKITTNTDANIKDQDQNTSDVWPRFMGYNLNGHHNTLEALMVAEAYFHDVKEVFELFEMCYPKHKVSVCNGYSLENGLDFVWYAQERFWESFKTRCYERQNLLIHFMIEQWGGEK